MTLKIKVQPRNLNNLVCKYIHRIVINNVKYNIIWHSPQHKTTFKTMFRTDTYIGTWFTNLLSPRIERVYWGHPTSYKEQPPPIAILRLLYLGWCGIGLLVGGLATVGCDQQPRWQSICMYVCVHVYICFFLMWHNGIRFFLESVRAVSTKRVAAAGQWDPDWEREAVSAPNAREGESEPVTWRCLIGPERKSVQYVLSFLVVGTSHCSSLVRVCWHPGLATLSMILSVTYYFNCLARH